MKKTISGILLDQRKGISFLLIALFVLTGFSSSAQPVVAIGLTKMNVLYRGVDNPATIAVSGVEQGDIKITSNNGTFKKAGDVYLLNPVKLGTTILTVFVKDKEVSKAEFRIKDLPDPVAKIRGEKSGIFEKSWLALMDKITAELDGSDFDYKFQILSFSVSTVVNGKEKTVVSKSEKFTKEQMELVKNIAHGAKLTISNIKVMGPEGTPRELQPMVLSVK